MPAEYFEQRERQLLGERFDTLYTAPTEAAARGATVSALRTDPATFARLCGFPVQVSPFCPQAFVVEQGEDFRPGRHPYHHAGVFYSQEPSGSFGGAVAGGAPWYAGAGPVRCTWRQKQSAGSCPARAGAAGEQRICPRPCRDPEKQPGADGRVQRSGGK